MIHIFTQGVSASIKQAIR